MSSRIESLTQAQIDAMPRYVQEWTRIGLCTAPADRPVAEDGVRMAYGAAGLPPPKRIVWTGSPLGNGLVWDSVGASVGDSVRASVGDSVRASVGDSVGASVGDSVGASVWDSVGASVWGQHEANWLAFYRFFRDECGLVSQTEPLEGLTQVARSAGWFIPYRDLCIISERHCTLHLNERGRLHCETGPAVAYPDGWSIWAWHGVRVPEWVIMQPERISRETIEAEDNAEIRRCMVERVGHEQAVDMLGAKETHRDAYGRLLKAAGHAWVDVENGTVEPDGSRRRYLLKVPTSMRTAKQAVAWTYGLTAKQYKVAVRT